MLCCERTMEKLVCNIGLFNPCLCKHPVKDVSVLRHCDDFATQTQIAKFKEHLSKHLLVKHIATLGPRPQLLDACEVQFVNRVTRWNVPAVSERVEIEADPKYSELMIKKSGLETISKGVNTSGARTRESNFHPKVPHHTYPMSCDSRTHQLVELNCSLPVKNC